MINDSRLADLRRRVELDPTSIAFAALAEEYRRAGRLEEAVAVCRTGLTRHPAYISARVTLGRALLDLGDLDAAEVELQYVVGLAPENLVATRALVEIRQLRDQPRGTSAISPASALPSNVIPFESELQSHIARSAAPAVSPAAERTEGPVLTSLDRLLDAIVKARRA